MASREELDRIYREELGRRVDSSGIQTFSGMSADQVRKAIRGSEEYKKKQGSGGSGTASGSSDAKPVNRKYTEKYTRDNFIQEYRSVKGKDPTEADIDNWVRYGKGVGHFTDDQYYEKNTVRLSFDKDNNQVERHTLSEDGTRYIANPNAVREVVIHKDEKAFNEFYGTAEGLKDQFKEGTVHLAPFSSLGKTNKWLTNPEAVTEDNGFYGYLNSLGLDAGSYGIIGNVDYSGNALAQDIFSNLSDLTGIKEIEEVGETVFDKWMPDELKFGLDPLGVWGNYLDEDWNQQGLQQMSDKLGGDLDDWQKGQAIANTVFDVVVTVATLGAAAPVTAARAGLLAAKNTVRQANQIIGAGGRGADTFGIDLVVNAASAVAGANLGTTTALAANFSFQTAGNMAKGMEFGQATGEAAWATAGGATFGVTNLVRAGVDKEYQRQIEESPGGWATFALQQGTSLYMAGNSISQQYDSQSLGNWGKAMLNNIGYKDGAFDLRVVPTRQTDVLAVSSLPATRPQEGVLSTPIGGEPQMVQSTATGPTTTFMRSSTFNTQTGQGFDYFTSQPVTAPGGSTVRQMQMTGFDAFKSNTRDLINKSMSNLSDAFKMTTPFGLLRAPSFTERGQRQQQRQFFRQAEKKFSSSVGSAIGTGLYGDVEPSVTGLQLGQ